MYLMTGHLYDWSARLLAGSLLAFTNSSFALAVCARSSTNGGRRNAGLPNYELKLRLPRPCGPRIQLAKYSEVTFQSRFARGLNPVQRLKARLSGRVRKADEIGVSSPQLFFPRPYNRGAILRRRRRPGLLRIWAPPACSMRESVRALSPISSGRSGPVSLRGVQDGQKQGSRPTRAWFRVSNSFDQAHRHAAQYPKA